MVKNYLILTIFFALTFPVIGQPLNMSIPFDDQPLDDSDYISPLSLREVYLSITVLMFGLILAIFSGIVAIKKTGWDQEATRMFSLSVIIAAGLFLLTAGYTDIQMSPMFGLLGAIVGYLFGKNQSSE